MERVGGVDVVYLENKSMKGFLVIWGIELDLGNKIREKKMFYCLLKKFWNIGLDLVLLEDNNIFLKIFWFLIFFNLIRFKLEVFLIF